MSSPTTTVLSGSELRALLTQYRRENWRGIQTPEWQARIVDEVCHDRGESIFGRLAGIWQVPERAVVLDIGSGAGTFVLACRRRGLVAFGIEPDRIGQGAALTSIQIARRRLADSVFAAALGEQLPFRDASFDLITMDQVMEHVSDQAAVLRQAARVLKPGGTIYLSSPNYLRFYEPHYKIFWFPLLPKILGRLYLAARGRNPVMLNQITYTTNKRLQALARAAAPDCTCIDLHREEFLKKCDGGGFVSFRARLVRWSMRLPLIGKWIRNAALFYLRITEGNCEMLIVQKSSSKEFKRPQE